MLQKVVHCLSGILTFPYYISRWNSLLKHQQRPTYNAVAQITDRQTRIDANNDMHSVHVPRFSAKLCAEKNIK